MSRTRETCKIVIVVCLTNGVSLRLEVADGLGNSPMPMAARHGRDPPASGAAAGAPAAGAPSAAFMAACAYARGDRGSVAAERRRRLEAVIAASAQAPAADGTRARCVPSTRPASTHTHTHTHTCRGTWVPHAVATC